MIWDNETDICPLVNPVARYFNENPLPATDEDASADMAATPALSAGGDTATLRFTGSAVQTVSITTKEGTGRILLTVDDAGTGPDGLEGPVYQYLTAELRGGMTDDEVSGAAFSFRVSAAWLNAEKLLPTDMALWRFHDNRWQELPPTSLLREENGWVYYEATTPGFSSFAIAAGDGQQVAVPPTGGVVPEGGTDTVDVAVTAEPVNETVTEPQVTVAIPGEEGTGTPTATIPQQSPLGFIPLIGGAAGAMLLFRKQE
ncbi:PGF-pre-PGF domain-containing protein [Methanogenium cariaci]|uniref:PGF-pre-PGF domain-containing protein n=1 Tax=Methanogenium cariaci TaxID=2197 RepID=UPI000780217E|nr:PGF-pre-PGF domain-containing protein [Methanogenium cariaci]